MITLDDLISKYKVHEVDFVFPQRDDTSVYIDIDLLYHSPHLRWNEVQSIIHEYFNRLLNQYREGSISSTSLTKSLEFPEVKLIALGYCKDGRDGRGSSWERAEAIKKAIFDDESINEIGIHALAKMSIVIPNVGPDTLSDMAANLGIKNLIDYTQEQSRIFDLKTAEFPVSRALNLDSFRWQPLPSVRLPYFENDDGSVEPRILVPRHLVRKVPTFSPEGFYNNCLRHILKHEEETRIVTTQAIGRKPKVTFKNILNNFKAEFGKKVSGVRKTAQERPHLVEEYALDPNQFHDKKKKRKLKEKIEWAAYIDELDGIPKSSDGAKQFAEYLRKVFTALYNGQLIDGLLEQRSEDSIFRYDVSFGNAADTSFFKMLRNQQFSAGLVIVEAKNYDLTNIGNEEFNQSRAYTISGGRELVFFDF